MFARMRANSARTPVRGGRRRKDRPGTTCLGDRFESEVPARSTSTLTDLDVCMFECMRANITLCALFPSFRRRAAAARRRCRAPWRSASMRSCSTSTRRPQRAGGATAGTTKSPWSPTWLPRACGRRSTRWPNRASTSSSSTRRRGRKRRPSRAVRVADRVVRRTHNLLIGHGHGFQRADHRTNHSTANPVPTALNQRCAPPLVQRRPLPRAGSGRSSTSPTGQPQRCSAKRDRGRGPSVAVDGLVHDLPRPRPASSTTRPGEARAMPSGMSPVLARLPAHTIGDQRRVGP